jgi:peptidyl-prolyl cis-trans isomerase A (cyclophilin A)
MRGVLLLAATLCLPCACGGERDADNPKPEAVKPDEAKPAEATGAEEKRKPPRPEDFRRAKAEADPQAPDTYAVKLTTTKGEIVIDVHREWAPRGADRFHRLVKEGYYTDVAFFRVLEGFMAQAGLHGDPVMNALWRERRIPDDPVVQGNVRGRVTFAMAGPDSRTTQFFINYGTPARLDSMGFAAFGQVRDMTAADALYAGYGEGAPKGAGPHQQRIHLEGNAYLKSEFPQLDYILKAELVEE